jgi:hypothetical protein
LNAQLTCFDQMKNIRQPQHSVRAIPNSNIQQSRRNKSDIDMPNTYTHHLYFCVSTTYTHFPDKQLEHFLLTQFTQHTDCKWGFHDGYHS